MTLSVRPPQLPDESLVGYLLRLTARNGYGNLSDWLPKQILNNIKHGALSGTYYKRLEELIGNPVKHQTILYQANLSPLFISPILESPRVCPNCIKENGHLVHQWQHVGNLYCEKHLTLLIDYCNYCGKSLSWNVNLLSGQCTNSTCRYFLEKLKAPKALLFLGEREIIDSYLAAHFDATPNTYLLYKTKHPHIAQITKTIEQGLSLLNEKEKLNEWFERLNINEQGKRCYPKSIRAYPAKLLLNQLHHQWPIHKRLPKLINQRANFEADNTVTPASIYLTSQALANELQLNALQLKDLISIIDPSHKHKRIISPIAPIDISLVLSHISASNEPVCKGLTIDQLSKGNANTRFQLLKKVLLGEIKFNYQPKGCFINSIIIQNN